ncbi:c-type cytochrome [Candidatus Binatus sp.]|uniref:c-type cytochrome n=1 Tax=Candidatus Binatus sp. TaxID=2811406 RepID=UPI003C52BAAB
MIRRSIALATAAGCAAIAAAVAYAPRIRAQQAPSTPMPIHQVPQAKDGGVVVMLCDGKTSMEVKGLKTGESMSHAQAVEVTRELMAKWQAEHPDEKWQMAQTDESSQPVPAPSAASGANVSKPSSNVPSMENTGKAPIKGQQQGDTYASFTDRDYKIWKNETDNFVAEGKKIFHSDKELGGTIGVSCDMCHPDASNTHPETYPKYQVQLQKVALLRDMIDWCIENPVKGKALDPNDPKLRALEAYILAQRKGVPLDYGKH